MIETIEIVGTWYIAGHSREKLSGKLSYSVEEGLILTLEGAFDNVWKLLAGPSYIQTPDWIVGRTSGGQSISLNGCLARHIDNSQSIYLVEIALIGYKYKLSKNVLFHHVSVKYHNLHQWASLGGFAREIETDPVRYRISYQRPNDIVLAENERYTIEIAASATFQNTDYEAKITSDATMIILFPQPVPLSVCHKFVRHVQDFLTLATGVACTPKSIEVFPDQDMDGKNKATMLYDAIRPEASEEIHPTRMLFRLNDIQALPVSPLEEWIERADAYKPIYNLFFSTQYSPFSYLEHQFLDLTQAIESFHRTKYGGKYQDDETYVEGLYREFVDALPDYLDEDFRQSLEGGKLKYANEYSLRKRLNELLSHMKEHLPQDYFRNPRERKGFIDSVVRLRNHLTHYTDSEVLNDDSGRENFLILIERLRLLIEACLLGEIGLGPDHVQKLLSGGQRLRLIRHLDNSLKAAR